MYFNQCIYKVEWVKQNLQPEARDIKKLIGPTVILLNYFFMNHIEKQSELMKQIKIRIST